MGKKENPIKFIYVTKFDEDTLLFKTKRLNVIKEYSNYVSLEDGRRIRIDDIYGVFAKETYGYVSDDDLRYQLVHGLITYTLKPIDKKIKNAIKKAILEQLKSEIEQRKAWLMERETRYQELKNEIAEKEAKLAKLLKL